MARHSPRPYRSSTISSRMYCGAVHDIPEMLTSRHSFCIKMPILHRLACFRDDVVFLIFLYQVCHLRCRGGDKMLTCVNNSDGSTALTPTG